MARYYRNENGVQPVDDFIEWLDNPAHQFTIDKQIDRINLLDESTPHLAFPHSSQIEGELRELRCHYGPVLYRILYRRSELFLILLHAFRKDTGKVPESEKVVARARWADFRARMDPVPHKRPSAIGKKAPSRKGPVTR